jgi:XisI protein
MDKIIKYQDILEQFLEEEATIEYANQNIERQVLADRKRNHFQLFSIGWDNDKFHHDIILHFDIQTTGKVWIQQNNTELQVADELITRGISRNDIVLGFRHPKIRPFTGFAVA